jgi:hypothetical protein
LPVVGAATGIVSVALWVSVVAGGVFIASSSRRIVILEFFRWLQATQVVTAFRESAMV